MLVLVLPRSVQLLTLAQIFHATSFNVITFSSFRNTHVLLYPCTSILTYFYTHFSILVYFHTHSAIPMYSILIPQYSFSIPMYFFTHVLLYSFRNNHVLL